MQNSNNGSQNVGIKNSWSLISFAKAHGRVSIGDCTNSKTAEVFKALAFTNPNDQSRVFVTFSSNLGVLTPQEIKERKDELQVVELESGNYKLCKAGQNNWEDIDLL